MMPRTESAPAPASSPAGMESLLKLDDVAGYLSCSRRVVERMRAAGKLPGPDAIVGSRSPRWKPATIRAWLDRQAKPTRGRR